LYFHSATTNIGIMILSSAHGELASGLPDDVAFQARSADEQTALVDLERIGFVHPMNAHSAWRWAGAHPRADRSLLALLAQFDLHLEIGAAADDTVWIAAAIQEHGGTTPTAFSGTGFSPDDAVRTCLGEFAEFQSWLYRPEDSARRCDPAALDAPVIDPWEMLGFTPTQRDRRHSFNTAWVGFDAIPAPDAFDGTIDWTEVAALTGTSGRWLPSQICFGRYGARSNCADRAWRADSNGCAAGPTRQNALARALLELVERDATGIWWHGRVRRPAVPRSELDDDPVSQALVARARMGQQVRLLDLTHDLEIPVVAAILTDADGALAAFGFGCHLDRVRAVRSAYRELCQMELSIAFARRRVARDGDAAQPEDRRLLDWLAKAGALPHLRPDEQLVARHAPTLVSDDEQAVALVCERLRRAGLDAYVRDLQRPEIGVPAVRAFAPGLCHFKPRFGFKRLTEVPRALRWRDARVEHQDVSDLPLLV
jgi:ribosomal protein S12 methylthiotransferase accessory factor